MSSNISFSSESRKINVFSPVCASASASDTAPDVKLMAAPVPGGGMKMPGFEPGVSIGGGIGKGNTRPFPPMMG